MAIIPEERSCCLSLRCRECFSCWPQHRQGRHILGRPRSIKRAAPPRQAPAPDCPGAHAAHPQAAGHTRSTHRAPAESPRRQRRPKCTVTVQAKSRAAGDKGDAAPILPRPIQHTGLERLQAVQGAPLQRPAPGWPGWELATGPVGAFHTTGPRHADAPPATHVSLQPSPALSPRRILLTIFFSPIFHSRMPEQKPPSRQGQRRYHFL